MNNNKKLKKIVISYKKSNKKSFGRNKVKIFRFNSINLIFKSFLPLVNKILFYYYILLIIFLIISSNNQNFEQNISLILVSIFLYLLKNIFEDTSKCTIELERNSQKVIVYRYGKWIEILLLNLFVGDIVKLNKNDIIHSDIVLLHIEKTKNKCIVDTTFYNEKMDYEKKNRVKGIETYFDKINNIRLFGFYSNITTNNNESFFNINQSNNNEEDNSESEIKENKDIKGIQKVRNSPRKYKNSSINNRSMKEKIEENMKNNNNITIDDTPLGLLEISKSKKIKVYENNIIYMGSKLKTNKSIYGLVINLFKTNDNYNKNFKNNKKSKFDSKFNIILLFIIVTYTMFFLVLFVISYYTNSANSNFFLLMYNITNFPNYYLSYAFENIINYYFLVSNLISFNLYFFIEIIKSANAYFINNDIDMYDPKTHRYSKCYNSNVLTDIPYLENIFWNKTGTITKNEFTISEFIIGDKLYSLKNKYSNKNILEIKNNLIFDINSQNIKEYDFNLKNSNFEHINNLKKITKLIFNINLICNTLKIKINDKNKIIVGENKKEISLIDQIKSFDLVYFLKKDNIIEFKFGNIYYSYKILHKIIISQENIIYVVQKDNLIYVMVKGLLSLFNKNLSNEFNKYNIFRENITNNIKTNFNNGFFISIYGIRILNLHEYNILKKKIDSNKINQELQISIYMKEIIILGSISQKNKLIKETKILLKNLNNIDLYTWILTNDSLKNTLSVCLNKNLTNNPNNLFIIGKDDENSKIKEIIEEVKITKNDNLIVVHSNFIEIFKKNLDILNEFLNLKFYCKKFIFYETTAVQKGELVKMIKDIEKSKCLVIGSTCNDNYMIKNADIGIGIVNKNKAFYFNSADIILNELKNIWKLWFVHSVWIFLRISRMFKNIFFATHLFIIPIILMCIVNKTNFYIIFNNLTFYSYFLVFTVIPLIMIGLFEKEFYYKKWETNIKNQLQLNEYPFIKKYFSFNLKLIRSEYISLKMVSVFPVMFILGGLLFIIIYFVINEYMDSSGRTVYLDNLKFELLIITTLCVNLKLLIFSNTINIIMIIFIISSMFLLFIFIIIFYYWNLQYPHVFLDLLNLNALFNLNMLFTFLLFMGIILIIYINILIFKRGFNSSSIFIIKSILKKNISKNGIEKTENNLDKIVNLYNKENDL